MNTVKDIFLVDDDAHDQEIFISALSRVNNAILYAVAWDGKEALAKLEKADILPSIIFMDIDMPGMNGIECLEKIIGNPKTKNIPVVMLTSSIHQQARTREMGARGFIVKPDNETTLVLKIQEAVEAECSDEVFGIGSL